MPSISAGNSASFVLGTCATLSVNAGSATGSVEIGSPAENIVPDYSASLKNQTFGPYAIPVSVVITVASGTAEYSISESSIKQAERRTVGARRNFHGNKFRLQLKGAFDSSSNQNMTRRIIHDLENFPSVHTVIAAIPNAYSGGVDRIPVVSRCNIRTSDSIGDAVWSDAVDYPDWQNFTLNGFLDMSCPRQSDEASGEVYGWVFSDPLPIKLKRYVGMTTWGRANTTRATAEHTFTAGPSGTITTIKATAFSQVGVNGVTTPADLNTPVYDTRMCAAALICLTDDDVYNITMFGGSQKDGVGDSTGWGFSRRMFEKSMLDGGKIVCTTNNADQAADTATQLKLFRGWMKIDPYCDEVQFPLTQGDDEDDADYVAGVAAGTVAGWEPYESRMKGQVEEVVTTCANLGIPVRITINRYKTDVAGSEYAMLRRLTDWARQREAEGYFLTDDMPSMFNDETAPVGTVKNPLHTSDNNVHPNELGADFWATTQLAKIRAGR